MKTRRSFNHVSKDHSNSDASSERNDLQENRHQSKDDNSDTDSDEEDLLTVEQDARCQLLTLNGHIDDLSEEFQFGLMEINL